MTPQKLIQGFAVSIIVLWAIVFAVWEYLHHRPQEKKDAEHYVLVEAVREVKSVVGFAAVVGVLAVLSVALVEGCDP